MTNTTHVKLRLHEQREHPIKVLNFLLKKGIMIEELDWDSKTEAVTIYKRFVLQKYAWIKKDKKSKYLSMTFSKTDLEKEKKKKMKLIKKIIEKQYEVLSYSFFSNLLSSVGAQVEAEVIDEEKFVKTLTKDIVKASEKIKIIEKPEVVN